MQLNNLPLILLLSQVSCFIFPLHLSPTNLSGTVHIHCHFFTSYSLTASSPFLLFLTSLSKFKPTPCSGCEPEVKQPPQEHLEIREDVWLSQCMRDTLLAFVGPWLGPRDAQHASIPRTLQNRLSWKQCPGEEHCCKL